MAGLNPLRSEVRLLQGFDEEDEHAIFTVHRVTRDFADSGELYTRPGVTWI